MATNEKSKNETRKPGPRHKRPAFQMRISTKYAPRKIAEGQVRSCIKDTSLTPEQMLELYRYLKLTRLVEERIVNLYRQTKVVGGVYRSLGQEATAVGSAYALRPDDFITPIIRDLGSVFVKGIRPEKSLRSTWPRPGDLPAEKTSTSISVIWRKVSSDRSRIWAT